MSTQLPSARHRFMHFSRSSAQYLEGKAMHHNSFEPFVTHPSLHDQSRRSSLAFSTLSDPSTSGSSGGSISQPVTPVNAGHLEMQWPDSVPSFVPEAATFHNSAPLLQLPFQKRGFGPGHGLSHFPLYTATLPFEGHGHYVNQQGVLSSNARPQNDLVPSSSRHCNDTRTTLYHQNEALEQDMLNAMLGGPNTTPGHLLPSSDNMSGLAVNEYEPVPESFYHSFGSTVDSTSGLPFDTYPGSAGLIDHERTAQITFDHGGHEPESFPTHGLIDNYFGFSQGQVCEDVSEEKSRASSPTSMSSLPSRRAPRRRVRNNVSRQVYHVGSESAPIEVVDEAQLSGGDDGRPRIPRTRGTRKLHFCKWIDEDGKQCDGRFERSEHLKRHYGKHSSERPFACRLPGCTKRIQRGDNAGDHFKSHLKGPRPGQRNSHFEWPDLQNSIRSSFEPKVAEKLCKNIRRWILQNHEGASQRKYLTRGQV